MKHIKLFKEMNEGNFWIPFTTKEIQKLKEMGAEVDDSTAIISTEDGFEVKIKKQKDHHEIRFNDSLPDIFDETGKKVDFSKHNMQMLGTIDSFNQVIELVKSALKIREFNQNGIIPIVSGGQQYSPSGLKSHTLPYVVSNP